MFAVNFSEASAAAIVERGGLGRIAVGLTSTIRLAMDPEDTQQVFVLTLALDRFTLPRLRSRMSRTADGRYLLEHEPAIDSTSVDYGALRQLPDSTLGGAYARMLEREKLDPDTFHAPPGIPRDLAYVVQRVRQTHDIWHVLTGLGTDVRGEIGLQSFSYGQLGQRTSLLIAAVGTGIYGLPYRGTASLARRSYQLGRRSRFMLDAVWEREWDTPLYALRERYGLPQAN